MKLSDAFAVIEARIAKSKGGTVTMTPDDLVKYVGEQIALAETEGDAGKERMAAVEALIEASKSAEAAGATSFEVKPFAPAVKAEPAATDDKDLVLEALAGLATMVKGLADSLSAAVKPPVEPTVESKEGEGAGVTEVGKSADSDHSEPAKPARVAWPTDLNKR